MSSLETLEGTSLVVPDGELDELERLERLRDRLLEKLRRQRTTALEFYAWYTTTQDPPNLPGDYAPKFGRMREMSRGAWGRLVVDATAERLELQGVRSTLGAEADDRAWSILQANRVDSDQRDVYTEAFIAGVSYVSIAGSGDDVSITPETALEVTHEHVPGDRRRVAAALKLVPMLDAGVWVAELYTPQAVLAWTAVYRDATRTPLADGARTTWGEPTLVAANELGAVPFVPFENRPAAATPGASELADLVPIMQRIAELELAKMVAAHTAVFRQKWATGLDVPKDPETGKPIEPFKAATDRLWVSEHPDTRFGSFEATEMRQYLEAISSEVGELAAISRVPSYYLVQSNLSNPPSAESLVASETGLVTKCVDRQRSFGESWEHVVRLAARAAGDTELADDRALEAVWRSPERRNPAVVADAATKIASVGVPTTAVWEFLGYSPQAIARMRVEAEAQMLREAALIPPAPQAIEPAAPTPPSG